MNFEDAKKYCHIRSGIYRTSDPTKIFSKEDLQKIHPSLQEINRPRIDHIVPKVYWKNHPISLDKRVPEEDKKFTDWEEYDPRDNKECSQYNEMPA